MQIIHRESKWLTYSLVMYVKAIRHQLESFKRHQSKIKLLGFHAVYSEKRENEPNRTPRLKEEVHIEDYNHGCRTLWTRRPSNRKNEIIRCFGSDFRLLARGKDVNSGISGFHHEILSLNCPIGT